MVFHHIDRAYQKVLGLQTVFGKLWYANLIIFRLSIVLIIGDSLYSDEQLEFRCDTNQPGCKNVCYNSFSPMSHIRFYGVQLIVCGMPVIVFLEYSFGVLSKRVYEDNDQNQTKNQTSQKSREIYTPSLLNSDHAYEHLSDKAEIGGWGRSRNYKKTFVGKFKRDTGKLIDEKTILKRSEFKQLPIPFQLKMRLGYILVCIINIILEILFICLAYNLQYNQSRKSGLSCFTVPERYECFHSEKFLEMGKPELSPCSQQSSVTCWVSRPKEKEYFMRYMLLGQVVSIILCLFDIFHISWRVMVLLERKRRSRNVSRSEKTSLASY